MKYCFCSRLLQEISLILVCSFCFLFVSSVVYAKNTHASLVKSKYKKSCFIADYKLAVDLVYQKTTVAYLLAYQKYLATLNRLNPKGTISYITVVQAEIARYIKSTLLYQKAIAQLNKQYSCLQDKKTKAYKLKKARIENYYKTADYEFYKKNAEASLQARGAYRIAKAKQTPIFLAYQQAKEKFMHTLKQADNLYEKEVTQLDTTYYITPECLEKH